MLTKSQGNGKGAMILSQHAPLLLLLILIIPFVLVGCQAVMNSEYDHLQKVEYIVNPVSSMLKKIP